MSDDVRELPGHFKRAVTCAVVFVAAIVGGLLVAYLGHASGSSGLETFGEIFACVAFAGLWIGSILVTGIARCPECGQIMQAESLPRMSTGTRFECKRCGQRWRSRIGVGDDI